MLLLEISTILNERLSVGYRELHPDIPWSAVVGMRNRIAHAYDEIDDEVVWSTLLVDIPALESSLFFGDAGG